MRHRQNLPGREDNHTGKEQRDEEKRKTDIRGEDNKGKHEGTQKVSKN